MKVRIAAVGLNHGHIYGQVGCMEEAGAEVAWFYATEPELIEPFQKRYPDAKLARNYQEILDDESVQVVATASIPFERAAVSMAAMRHGKDVLSDKPGFTTLAQLEELRAVQQETGRIYSILFGERLENAACMKAAELVRSGAIGRVVQTMGWGPHRGNFHVRYPWFFEREKYGGIICDIGSHQSDQFLYFTGARDVEIVSAQVGNLMYPQYFELEDFGDVTLRGKNDDGDVFGYYRVDWFTPAAMPAFGDGRLLIIGSEGTLEVRKYCDVGGHSGSNHLFLVDNKEVKYIDCSGEKSPFGRLFVEDIINRTETAMTQEHCYAAAELTLRCQAAASRHGYLANA